MSPTSTTLLNLGQFKEALHFLLTFHNKLIYMYVKCGSLVDARKLFAQLKERDSFSWNTIIASYRRHGCPHKALSLFHRMQETVLQPDQFTFACVLPACAHELFDEMPHKNVFLWTAMIAGYAQNGFVEKALETFKQNATGRCKAKFHNLCQHPPCLCQNGSFGTGYGYPSTVLVDMYAKCGSIDKARELFDRMPKRDAFLWTTMIGGYAQHEFVEKAFETFNQMQLAGVKPDSTTFASILRACAKIGALEHVMDIHQSIMDRGNLSEVVVATALIDMYAKCGYIDKARNLFEKIPQKNVVSWSAMIAGYAQNGYVEKAFENFKQMLLAGVEPDSTTYASILPACAKIGALEQGMEIHKSIINRGNFSDVIVTTALVDMYAKCGSVEKARALGVYNNIMSQNRIFAGHHKRTGAKDLFISLWPLTPYSSSNGLSTSIKWNIGTYTEIYASQRDGSIAVFAKKILILITLLD